MLGQRKNEKEKPVRLGKEYWDYIGIEQRQGQLNRTKKTNTPS